MAKKKPLNAMFRSPIKNDHYGFRYLERDFQGRLHPGVDLNGPGGGNADEGTPIHPIGPGVVTFISIGKNGGWGNIMYVKHDMVQYFLSFGLDKPEWCPDFVWSQYAHLKEIMVMMDDEVHPAEPIATLGGTGGWSAHLHHEIRKRPLGVYYYPSGKTVEQMNSMYFDPDKFVASVNEYITVNMTNPPELPSSRLIKAEGQPEVYVFNMSKKFHIPDEQTALLLFGPDWVDEIEECSVKVIKNIEDGDPIPSMK